MMATNMSPIAHFIAFSNAPYPPSETNSAAPSAWMIAHVVTDSAGTSACAARPHALISAAETMNVHSTRYARK